MQVETKSGKSRGKTHLIASHKSAVQEYACYKDSGVAWLGEIPGHWELKRFKHIFREKKKITNINLNCGSISFGKVVYKDNEKVPESTKRSYQVLSKGEFLINPLNLNYDLISLRIALSDKDVVVSSGYIVVQNIIEIDKNYFKWLLHIFDVAFMKTLGAGVRQTLSFNHISNSEFVYPPLQEQTAIAQFLDDKTTKIDAAIGIKKEQIKLLKERKQILIHKAVTRGLDEKVKMKDSGVDWIGEMPEHWAVKRLKHVTSKIGSGVTPSGGGTTYLDEGIPLLRSQNIFFDKIELDGVAFISDKIHQSMNNSQVFKGDVLLNITGGSIGRCYFVDLDIPLNVNQHVCIMRPNNKITTLYLNSLISSKVGQNQIWFHQQGGGREGLNFQALKNFDIPYPPLSEQKEISAYIESASQKIDIAMGLKQQEIEKLKEYKSSLINGVVTGKVKISKEGIL